MNTIGLYFIEIAVTLIVCCAVVIYLRQSLRRVLVDAELRARFGARGRAMLSLLAGSVERRAVAWG